MQRLAHRLAQVFAAQQGHLFPWLAVAYAVGIGTYFSLRFEPGLGVLSSVAGAGLLGACAARWRHELLRPLGLALLFVVLGLLVAAWRAHSVAGPVIDWRYYGPVEGRIVGMDRSASDAVRLTLDQVRLARVDQEDVPLRVRISLHGDAAAFGAPAPGFRVMTTAHLGPPGGPVEPGGFDFQRHAWFLQLGAVGYTRVPVLAIAPAEGSLAQSILRLRLSISAHVQSILPGDVGGFAAAVTTGDRSGISQTALENLRASNTAHLLAISGLHMGLLSAFVFGVLRLGLALIPALALRWPIRQIAAIGALGAATGYLALSGGNVATERAYIMVAAALVALLLGRQVLSLRTVALAALVVLTLRPEAMLGPGFQMSFAATTALVAVFQALRGKRLGQGWPGGAWLVSLIVSSAVAGLATAPIGAAHFNAISHYGLFANLLSVPLMGILVVPASVAAALLSLIGAEALALWVMGLGLQWILAVASTVAALDGARSFVPGPPGYGLPLIAFGALWLILWHGKARWLGAAPMILALLGWITVQRPAILIAEGGTLVGVMTSEGRALSKARGGGFVATNWLENDGERTEQAVAAARWAAQPAPVRHIAGKRALAAFDGCQPGEIIVSNQSVGRQPCRVFDKGSLRRTGAVALFEGPDGYETLSVRDVTGTRLWSLWPGQSRAKARNWGQ